MDNLYAEILNLAADAARKAGTFIREARKTGLHVDAKSRIDFVSDKDKMSENMIREMILEKYPDHLFFGEESVYGCTPEEEKAEIEAFRDEDFVWVVDPIDGTVNYIRDYPQYAISIGVVHHRKIVAGVIYDPFRDELFTALAGKGAFRNGERIHVSSALEAGDAIINTSMPTNSMQTRADMVSRIPQVSGPSSPCASGTARRSAWRPWPAAGPTRTMRQAFTCGIWRQESCWSVKPAGKCPGWTALPAR